MGIFLVVAGALGGTTIMSGLYQVLLQVLLLLVQTINHFHTLHVVGTEGRNNLLQGPVGLGNYGALRFQILDLNTELDLFLCILVRHLATSIKDLLHSQSTEVDDPSPTHEKIGQKLQRAR